MTPTMVADPTRAIRASHADARWRRLRPAAFRSKKRSFAFAAMTSIETSARATGTIERAVNVLREATALKGKVQTRGVGLALWVLRGRCPDEWLVAF